VFTGLDAGGEWLRGADGGVGAAGGGFADEDDEGADFGFVEGCAEGGHAGAADAVADDAGEAGAVGGVRPFGVQKAGGFSAAEVGAVAVGAELGVEGGGVARRGVGRARRGGEQGEDHEAAGRKTHGREVADKPVYADGVPDARKDYAWV